jgi:S1-C subfamily serine protease
MLPWRARGPRLGPRALPRFAILVIFALVLGACSLQALVPTAGQPTPVDGASTFGTVVASATVEPTSSPDGSPIPPIATMTPVPRQTATPIAAAPPTTVLPAGSGVRTTVATDVYRMNGQSVVNITSLALVQTRRGTAEQQGIGSGFVIDNRGYIVTNEHVVHNAQELTVTFFDGSTVVAELVGSDPDNDLAVVRVDPSADAAGKPVGSILKSVKLGDSSTLVVGEDLVAIGSPFGLQQTVTKGIVSAIRAPGEELTQGDLPLLGGAVQTDAAINPGNSGGPLFNAAGEVIGVNTFNVGSSGGSVGLGFAIPVNIVKRVVPDLIEHGCVRHPVIEISVIPLSQIGQSAKRDLGLPTAQKGLLVQGSSGGAAAAGIKAGSRAVSLGGGQIRIGGDIVVAIDGQPTASEGDLRAYVENNRKPGDTVSVTILRDGQRQDMKVVLGTSPATDLCR